MIKYSEIKNVFHSYDIAVEEYNIETIEEIYFPYIVYTPGDYDSFSADSMNYLDFVEVRMALIDQVYNTELQSKIETILKELELHYEKGIDFDDDQRLYTVVFSFYVIDG